MSSQKLAFVHPMLTSTLYTIGDVAKLVDVCSKTIREWEQRGYIPRPKKRHPRTKARLYCREEIEALIIFRDGETEQK